MLGYLIATYVMDEERRKYSHRKQYHQADLEKIRRMEREKYSRLYPEDKHMKEKWTIKRALWFSLGMFCLGLAYVGVVTPGIPFSIFLVIAAACFAKSSKKWHDWIFNHKYFGPFLTNWYDYRVFPNYAKYSMIVVMASTLIITYWLTSNVNAVLWSGIAMACVAIWAWRYPSSKEEYDERKKLGKKVAWLR